MAELPDPNRMEVVAKRQTTKSDKIRALAREGYSRSQIANFLGVRYQFVRNVLVGAAGSSTRGNPGAERASGGAAGIRNRVRLKLDAGGRVLIPAGFREAMQVGDGGTVLAWLDGGELRLTSSKVAMREAQQLARRLVVGKDSLADELIAERRKEAKRESKRG